MQVWASGGAIEHAHAFDGGLREQGAIDAVQRIRTKQPRANERRHQNA